MKARAMPLRRRFSRLVISHLSVRANNMQWSDETIEAVASAMHDEAFPEFAGEMGRDWPIAEECRAQAQVALSVIAQSKEVMGLLMCARKVLNSDICFDDSMDARSSAAIHDLREALLPFTQHKEPA